MQPGEKKRIDYVGSKGAGFRSRRRKPGRLARFSFRINLDWVVRPLGGKEAAIDLVRSSDDPGLRRLVAAWDLPRAWDKTEMRLEQLCADCKVAPDHLLAEVIAIWWRRYAASPTAGQMNGALGDADMSFPAALSLETDNLLDPQFGAGE